MAEKKRVAYTGATAAAEAMRQIDPDVVAAYPITPQTEIMHEFSQYVADGDVGTELITVESEHSAMSACVGASAAGARAMTATAANGLALMWEIVYIAASNRLPIVMNVVNRALSGPINIHCDHSDSMGCRDTGWIQLFSENAQDVYDNTLMAMRIAEDEGVFLPVMVCQDGFITSHSVETMEAIDDRSAKAFVGEHQGHHPLLDTAHPVTSGPLDLFDYYFEHKAQQLDAMESAKGVIRRVFSEFSGISGRQYDYFEPYRMEDAEMCLVAAGSSCGTIKVVVDDLRAKGRKVGLLKMRVFRPFMADEVTRHLGKTKAVAVLDRSASFGALGGPVFTEVRSAFHESRDTPRIIDYLYGLGGRELDLNQIYQMYDDLEKVKGGETGALVRLSGVRR
ncbi:pyruvate ferredoxin oxidoreductase [Candidatus Woesearchaeota archaeon]|nr:pyruvate ferredoxin oxidoreductase [Candidatus Woesearchaeota archaeon]